MNPGERFGEYAIDGVEAEDGHVRYCRARRVLGGGGEDALFRPCRLRLVDLGSTSEMEASFIAQKMLDEARLVVGLNHPGVVATLSYGQIDAVLYFEDERIPGTTLASLLQRTVTLPVGIALHVACHLAEVLQYVHGAVDVEGAPLDLVHRNLRPDLVFLTPYGEVKLSGFGMAHYMGRWLRTTSGARRSRTRCVSPEEFRGEEPDARSDLFGLGVLLYQMVKGTTPFAAIDDAAWARFAKGGAFRCPPARPIDGDRDDRLSGLLHDLLSDDRERRPRTASEVWQRCWDLWRVVGRPDDGPRLRRLVQDAL